MKLSIAVATFLGLLLLTNSVNGKIDASLYGLNLFYQLGYYSPNIADISRTPVSVPIDNASGVAVGRAFSVAWNDTGIFTVGSNLEGELGQNATRLDLRNSTFWRQVHFDLAGEKIAGVTTHRFTIAWTTGGRVFGWGQSPYGQLGQNDTEAQLAPVQLGGDIVGKFITSVSCGCSHCVALDADGNVYSWGKNTHGQLGTGNYDNKLVPTLIPHLSAYNVTQANAGCDFTLLFTNSSEIWGFGVNIDGVLGVPMRRVNEQWNNVLDDPHFFDVLQPVKMDIALDSLYGEKVKTLSVGDSHVVITTASGRLFTLGRDHLGQLGYRVEVLPLNLVRPATWRFREVAVSRPDNSTSDQYCFDKTWVGLGNTVARTYEESTAFAWGLNDVGQLATNSSDPILRAVREVNLYGSRLSGVSLLDKSSGFLLDSNFTAVERECNLRDRCADIPCPCPAPAPDFICRSDGTWVVREYENVNVLPINNQNVSFVGNLTLGGISVIIINQNNSFGVEECVEFNGDLVVVVSNFTEISGGRVLVTYNCSSGTFRRILYENQDPSILACQTITPYANYTNGMLSVVFQVDPCRADLTWLWVVVAVVVALVIIVCIVVVSVPSIRAKVFPFMDKQKRMEENEKMASAESREKSKWTFFRKNPASIADVEVGFAYAKPEKIEDADIPAPIMLPKKKKKPTQMMFVNVDSGSITSTVKHPDYLAEGGDEDDEDEGIEKELAPRRTKKARAVKQGTDSSLVDNTGSSTATSPTTTPRVATAGEIVALDPDAEVAKARAAKKAAKKLRRRPDEDEIIVHL